MGYNVSARELANRPAIGRLAGSFGVGIGGTAGIWAASPFKSPRELLSPSLKKLLLDFFEPAEV